MPRIGSRRKLPSLSNESKDVKQSKTAKLTPVVPRRKLSLSADQYNPIDIFDVVLTCGNAEFGQLGHGEKASGKKCATPAQIQLDPPAHHFLQVAAGSFHTVVLTSGHQVYTSGCNDDCALGRECYEDTGKAKRDDDQDFVLRPVSALDHFTPEHGHPTQISAGDSHTVALTANGSVLVWGTFRDKQGCLGLSFSPSKGRGSVMAKAAKPIVVSSFRERRIVKISSGFNHVTLLSSDGVIWTLGAGDAGQLGRLAPQFRDGSVSLRAKARMLVPMVVAPEHSRKKIYFNDIWSAGYCCFARATDGSVFVWGLNNYYQLGYVPNDPDQTTVFYPIRSDQFKSNLMFRSFSGDHHIVALDEKSNVYAIGRGDDSRLGATKNSLQQTLVKLEKFSDKAAGVAAGNSCSFVWQKDGSVFVWGYDMEGETGLGLKDSEEIEQPTQLNCSSLKNVRVSQVAVGGQHAVFLGAAK